MSPLLPALLAVAVSGLTASAQWVAGPAFPSAPTAREHAVAIVAGTDLYAIGGTPFLAPNLDSPVHHLASGAASWADVALVEGTIVDHGAGIDSLGRIIVFGGQALVGDDEGKSYSWEPIEGKIDETGARGASAPLIGFAWATDSEGRIYSLGGGPGATPTSGDPNVAYAERYDAQVDAWLPIAPLLSPVADGAGVNDGQGRLLVIGGFDAAGTRTTNVAAYDVAQGTWSDTLVPDLPVALSGARAVLGADQRVYVLGGSDGTSLATTWVLDAPASSWSVGPAMSVARENFAAALGPDDHVWALGGSNDVGGTATVERLYTPPCPQLVAEPATTKNAWLGQILALAVDAAGGTPLSYSWRRDGIELVDGPAPGGGVLSGTDTAALALTAIGTADAGEYSVVVTNPCGSVTSAGTTVTLVAPPSTGTAWAVRNLHPAGALASRANAVDGATIGGSSTETDATYGSLEHPVLWHDANVPALSLVPAGSVGGAVSAIDDDVQVGWYWWPYTTPQGTGYHQHSCAWTGTAASHVDVQPSGWEFGSLSDVDAGQFVGTMRWDESSTNADGGLWNAPVKSALILTPGDAWGSSATSVDAGEQFGSVHIGFGVVHAAKWSGSSSSHIDVNPPGSSWSYITAAADGQQVGRATFAGEHRPMLWSGSAEGTIDMLPTGATSATLNGVGDGLQVGVASFGGASGAALFASAPGMHVDLHSQLSADYSTSSAEDVDLDVFGTLTVVGHGYDSVAGRTEALVWQTQLDALASDVEGVVASTGGTQRLRLFAGPEHAGRSYLMLGSVSGTSPGVTLPGGIPLPLNWDAYTNLLLGDPLPVFLPGATGVLDDRGMAEAEFTLAPGTPLPFAFTLHHAAVVLGDNGKPVFASNAVAVALEP